MTPRISGPKGAPDLIPPAADIHHRLVGTSAEIFERYGFRRIETPIFEHTEVFERGLEARSEVVTKQMYTFSDRGGRSLTLRPDMTAPVMRAVLEHGLDRAGLPIKLWYSSPIFRHERPQSGRFRQFTQIGAEVIGAPDPVTDAEVIVLAGEILASSGVEFNLLLNSVGHPGCRAGYLPVLKEFLRENSAALCEDCRRKIDVNPLRTFDCKVESDRKVMEGAPVITNYLCDECAMHFSTVKGHLEQQGAGFTEQPRLVRGLDYYMRTAFEFTAAGLGSQDAVGAGGRYDGLSQQLGGPGLPGIGFGLGIERMLLAAGEAGGAATATDAFVVAVGERARPFALALAQRLRRAGVSADFDHLGRGLKGQMKAAARSGALHSVIVGDKEIEADVLTVKTMETGAEEQVSGEMLPGYLQSRR